VTKNYVQLRRWLKTKVLKLALLQYGIIQRAS